MVDSIYLDDAICLKYDSRDFKDEKIDYGKIARKVAYPLTIAVTVGLALIVNSSINVSEQQRPAIVTESFGEAVSSEEVNYASLLVTDFFSDIDVSSFIAESRANSKYTYDNADTEARALELLTQHTNLLSIDGVVSIEDEYRVSITISTVDGYELMQSNRSYLLQAFCSDKNNLIESDMNRVLLEIIEKHAKADSVVETYVTVKDGSIDATQLVTVLKGVLKDMKSTVL